MLKLLESRIFWGVLLIVGGVLFLLQSLFGIQLGGLFWSIVFVLGGLFFLSIFFANRAHWWAIIPGFTLIGISGTIAAGELFPSYAGTLGGSFVLGAIGLSFLVIYLLNREFWWAIIPCGVLLTLTIVIPLEGVLTDLGFVSLFFLGMALTFAIVAMVPTPEGRMQWPWIPAGILGLMGILFGAFSGAFMAYLVPLALILVGGILIFQTLRKR
jgi:hypothetical protein